MRLVGPARDHLGYVDFQADLKSENTVLNDEFASLDLKALVFRVRLETTWPEASRAISEDVNANTA
jgi:hypothetical protein